jgi:hypothetical protein
MRVLIACAGPDTKWANHLGVPRHLVPMAGEPLLHRTARQSLAISGDVHVISGPDERYRLPGTTWHIHTDPTPNEFMTTRQWWSQDDRTVLLLGDTYYTDYAIDVIAGYDQQRWQLFGRENASQVTGTPWGEYFACSWWPQQQQMMLEHLDQVILAQAVGIAQRCTGWELLRSIQRTPLNEHKVNPMWFAEIDDETDDFDFPHDYARHPKATPGPVKLQPVEG